MILLSVFSLSAEVVPAQRKKDIEKARKLAKQGDQLFNKKDYRNAANKYGEAIAVLPNFPAAYFWKGYSHYYLNEYDQAINNFNQAETQGFDKPVEIYKVRWYLNYQAKNYDAALTDVQEALKLDPNNIAYNLAVGDIYRLKDSCREAMPYYKKVSELDLNNSDVNYYLAVCHAKQGETVEQGIAALEALKRKTQFVGESSFYAADSLYKQKKYDEAVEFYQRSIDLKPDNYASYNALSDIYRNRNEFDKAIAVTRKGLENFPKDSNLYTSLAWYYSLADRPQDAIVAARSAINLAPDQYMGYTNLCRAYNDAKEYQMAITTCNSALRLNPGDGETLYYLGRAHEFLKQTDRAADAYKKAVDGLIKFTRETPDYSDGFYLLGNAYFALGKDDEAISAYNKCLQIAPRFARARYTLGLTYLIGKKDKVKAREQYNILRGVDNNLAEKLRQEIEKAK
jgi:tetratricopeptide (TPR) repeat protein